MSITQNDLVRVPGARLYYQVRGSGPLLLSIAGGAGDADSSNGLVNQLVERYTVVTYDRRGYWRSPLDDPDQRIEIETHSEDVHHLLAALGAQPAFVLGSSIGALIGLDLAIHHPAQVRTLVAHEPPVVQLMSEAERANRGLLGIYQREGGAEAITKFAASIGVHLGSQESNLGLPQTNARIAEYNRESFFKHDAGAVGRYRLDIDALKATPTRVVVAGGCAGRDYFPYQVAVKLTERLGPALVEFPGNHAGMALEPQEFAAKLCAVMGE